MSAEWRLELRGDASVTPSWSSSLPAAEKKQPATFRATQVAQSVHTLLIKLELAVTKTVGQTRRSYILNLNYFLAPSSSTASSNEGGSDVTLRILAQILQSRILNVQFFFFLRLKTRISMNSTCDSQTKQKKTTIIVYRYFHEQPCGKAKLS